MEHSSVEEYMERIRVLDALEQQAMGLSRMLTTYTDRLQERLDKRLEIEEQIEQVTFNSIKNLHNAVDESVRMKMNLVEKCNTLNKEMKEIDVVVKQVGEIKQMLDVIEHSTQKS